MRVVRLRALKKVKVMKNAIIGGPRISLI